MDSETQRLIEAAALAGARKYAAMQKKEQQKKIIHNTYALMESYVALKKHTTSAISDAAQVESLSGSKEYVYNAIREADLYKKHSFDYIDRILSTWKSEGKIFEEE